MIQIIIDTNVFITALRSKKGASFKLFTLIGKGDFETNVSVPLIIEYEDVVQRDQHRKGLSNQDIDDILN
jgi:putative PIN family toxin of toxin-antitoxin system